MGAYPTHAIAEDSLGRRIKAPSRFFGRSFRARDFTPKNIVDPLSDGEVPSMFKAVSDFVKTRNRLKIMNIEHGLRKRYRSPA